MRPLCLLAFALAAAGASDWPQFRGPNGSGIATGDDPYPTQFHTLWQAAVPAGLSSPVVVGSRVLLTGLDGPRFALLALDRASGRELWRRHLPRPRAEKLHKLNHAASPSVVSDGQSIVAFFPDFGLAAFSLDGRELWRTPLGPFKNIYGMGVSPILANGRVILIVDQSQGSYAAAFSLRNGEQLWRTPPRRSPQRPLHPHPPRQLDPRPRLPPHGGL